MAGSIFSFIFKWLPILGCILVAVWFINLNTALSAQGSLMCIFLAGMWWMMNTETKKSKDD
jgi:hypothetical protein